MAHKVASTPQDPARAVEQGLRDLLDLGVAAADVASITHGTTIGLNAILQRRVARVAVLTSRGHRDLVHIGRARLPRSFDLHATPPRPVVDRDQVVEIDLRFTPDGAPVGASVTRGSDAYRDARAALVATAADAVTVCLVGGYAAPEREAELAALLAADLGVPVTSAGALWPEAGEYERTALAVLDAQIRPLMTSYLTSLRERVAGIGLTAPLFISTSNGGSVSFADAIARPVVTVLSGPASGVAAAGLLWPDTDLVTFDMGGTSSDIGVVGAGRPAVTTGTTIGDHPLTMPVVDVEAIGAGGGSVAWVDTSGEVAALRVGPRSVGAHPGPVAYGLGGAEPSLTDAYVHAGALADGAFLEGRMRLDAPAATAALTLLAEALDDDVPDASAAVDAALRTATAGMSTRVRTVLARHGEVPDAFTFVAFGGAGGTHSALLARDLGVRRVIVPTAAATFCALGAALAPVRRDLVRSLRARADDDGIAEISDVAAAVVGEALAWWHEQGAGSDGDVVLAVDARYDGQPTTLTVEVLEAGTAQLDADGVAVPDPEALRAAFGQAHERYHGFADPVAPVLVEAVRVAVSGRQGEVLAQAGGRRLAKVGRRELRLDGRWHDAAVLAVVSSDDASDASGGAGDDEAVTGPAVVEKGDTSVLVPPGWSVRVAASGDLLLGPVAPSTGTATATVTATATDQEVPDAVGA